MFNSPVSRQLNPIPLLCDLRVLSFNFVFGQNQRWRSAYEKSVCFSRVFSFRPFKRDSLLGPVSSIAHKALRPIALFEAFKGAVVLVAGFGLLSFLGRD